MKIENHISQLLFKHDCVIIPQFGGFVGNYKPATLDRIQNKFSPPSKEISFNKNLIHNDGLLANHISISENVGYEEANIILKKYSDDLKSDLRNGKKIIFEEVGTLAFDENRNILFEPGYSKNYLLSSFGLTSFHSPKIKNISTESQAPLRENAPEIKFIDRPPAGMENTAGKNKKITVSRKRVKKIILYSAVAFPLICFLLWIPFNLKKLDSPGQNAGTINYSNLFSFGPKNLPVFSPRENPSSPDNLKIDFSSFGLDKQPNQSLNFPDSVSLVQISFLENEDEPRLKGNKITVRLKQDMEKLEKPGTNKKGLRLRFHIIGGCFQYIENAEKFLKQIKDKGYNAAILDKHKGLYRVSYQSFVSRSEALGILARVKSTSDGGAWLLVK